MKILEIITTLDTAGIDYTFNGESGIVLDGFSSILNYREGTVTFIVPERRISSFNSSLKDKQIALLIMGRDEICNENVKASIIVDDPKKVFFFILDTLFSTEANEEDTLISNNPEVYKKNSTISNYAIIGNNVAIGIGCVIEGNVIIGDNTEIHHNVVIRNKTKIGNNCTIHSGTVIGESGFGVTVSENGEKAMLKHYGGVLIEDDVHIGDQCCIIRGTIDDTIIHKGVKLNTMVHIAHNDEIGCNTIITAPTHVCGSVTIGDNCHIAGTIIRNKCSIGDNTVVGLGSVVVNSIDANTVVVGNPAIDMEKR